MSRQTMKRSIIDATIKCVEENGIQEVTVREITEKADVNTASINYYFGTKEDLIQQALEEHFENMIVNWEVILERRGMNFTEGLKTLLREIMEETRQHPHLITAHLYEPFIQNQTNKTPILQRFDRFLHYLLDQKHQAQPDKDEQTHKLEIMQLFAGVLFPGLLSQLFRDFTPLNLDDTEDQRKYINRLVSKVADYE